MSFESGATIKKQLGSKRSKTNKRLQREVVYMKQQQELIVEGKRQRRRREFSYDNETEAAKDKDSLSKL